MSTTTLTPERLDELTDKLVAALKTVYDPEIPVDIYELGLIYRIDVSEDMVVTIDMTLTAPDRAVRSREKCRAGWNRLYAASTA